MSDEYLTERSFASTDTSENDLLMRHQEVLELLLKDHTTQKNIIWASDSYEHLGAGYGFNDCMSKERITGAQGRLIRPRSLKSLGEQTVRTKDRAEVFTPAWVCNSQNNLFDESWFGRADVFNVEDLSNKTWQTVTSPISFPEGKTWKDYVRCTCLEITCGEAPYLVSRYDAITGESIPLVDRIGILDRKLRVISENTSTSQEWLQMAQEAYKNVYAYEWQGDSLLLAREALLVSFVEYFQAKFGRAPAERSLRYIAYIISWNVWQMDGLKCVIPRSCRHQVTEKVKDLFGEKEHITICEGCAQDILTRHNGIYCLIQDWQQRKRKTGARGKIRFVDLFKQANYGNF